MSEHSDVVVRLATESDVEGIRDVVLSCYGGTFFPEFYESFQLKKMIFGEETLMLVAEDSAKGKVCGIAAVLLEIGAFSDLLGEFGRLAVHPDYRRRGIAGRLLEERVRIVQNQLHVGLLEARVSHAYSVMNGRSHDFSSIGFLPAKLRLGEEREHLGLMVRYFGDALKLRRNHPRLIPEAHRIATQAMENVGLEPDFVVDEHSLPYPPLGKFEIEELTAEGYASLLRIERGRVEQREIFGPMRLQYGFFKLTATESTYLIARRDGRFEAALGFTLDKVENNVRVFEFIQLGDGAVRALFEVLERRCKTDLDVATVEVDVSAYAPRMQRTLLELGYVPSAYIPAMVFHRVERLDVLRMVRVLTPFDLPMAELPKPASELATLVLDSLADRAATRRVREELLGIDLFNELTSEQQGRLAGRFGYLQYSADEVIFNQGKPADCFFVILDGRVSITVDGETVGHVGPGECLGEVAVLTESDHSASAIIEEPVHVAVLTRDRLGQLVRERPDIGVVLYKNLAANLGRKLRRADRRVVPTAETR